MSNNHNNHKHNNNHHDEANIELDSPIAMVRNQRTEQATPPTMTPFMKALAIQAEPIKDMGVTVTLDPKKELPAAYIELTVPDNVGNDRSIPAFIPLSVDNPTHYGLIRKALANAKAGSTSEVIELPMTVKIVFNPDLTKDLVQF